MISQKSMPNPSVDLHLLSNLRHARLEVEKLGLELDEVLARFDEQVRQQKLKRIQKSLSLFRENLD